VHINSNNDFVLASGYSNDVRIYDIETGAVLQEYKDAHSNHINISRFANLSPFIFTTSSFDRKAKTWDMRMRMREPIYFMECSSGIVMISYSPDDTFILASALDNEISQFLTVDGRRHTTFQVPRTGLEGNFTRAYYSSSGAYVATGACEESSISLLCASTGQLLARQEMYPGRKHSSLYVQV
jgi:WD40 repeat protein